MSDHADILLQQGRHFLQTGDASSAIERFKKAKALCTRDPQRTVLILRELITAYRLMQRYVEAAEYERQLQAYGSFAGGPSPAGINSGPTWDGHGGLSAFGGRTLLIAVVTMIIVMISAVTWWATHSQSPIAAGTTTTTTKAPTNNKSPDTAVPMDDPLNPPLSVEEAELQRANNVGLVLVMGTYTRDVDGSTISLDVPLFSGSAFAISNDGRMITNRHVAYPKKRPSETITFGKMGEFHRTEKPYLIVCFGPKESDRFTVSSVLDMPDRGLDLVVLKVNRKFAKPLKLSEEAVHQGDTAFPCGFPGVVADVMNASNDLTSGEQVEFDRKFRNTNGVNMLDFWAKASFKNIRTDGGIGQTSMEFGKDSYTLFTAKIAHGNSGGPLLNAKNDVIGVVTLKTENNGNAEYEGYNLAIPVSVLRAQLDQMNLLPQ